MLVNSHDAARRAIVGADVVVMRRGFVVTTRDQKLTTYAAIEAAGEKAEMERKKKYAEAVKEACKPRLEKEQAIRSERARWAARAKLAGVTVGMMRLCVGPLAIRCAVAKLRAEKRSPGTVLKEELAAAHQLLAAH